MKKANLLMEDVPRKPFTVMESPTIITRANGTKAYKLSGVFQNFEEVNLNNRVYPESIWDKQLSEGSEFHTRLSNNLALGLVEHPADGITDLGRVALRVTEARKATPEEILASEGKLHSGDIVGSLELLETPQGQILIALTEAGIPWGVSSRGNGSIREGSADHDIVDDDFQLETWDAVFSPSVARAIPSLLKESTNTAKLTESISKLDKTWEPIKLTEAKPSAPPAPAAPVAAPAATTVPTPTQAQTPAPTVTEQTAKPTPPTTKMNKLQEMRSLKTEATTLGLALQGKIRAMKPSDRIGFIEQIDSLRYKIGALVSEDPSIKAIAEGTDGQLSALALKLDEEFGDEFPAAGGAPAAEGPPAGGPPADPAAPPTEEPAAEDEVVATLQSAADKLRELGGEDPAAEEAAAGLDDLADRVSEVDADAEGMEDVNVEELPLESRRVIRAVQRRLKVAEAQLVRMGTGAVRLLDKHKKLTEANAAGGKFEGHTIQEWATAAKELAKTSKTAVAESLTVGRQYLKAKNPTFYTENAAKIEAFTKYADFVAFVESALKPAAAPAKTTPGAPAPVAESRKPNAPAPTPSKPAPTPLAEDVHPQVAFNTRQRAYGQK